MQIGVISYAFDKIGIPSGAPFSLLLLSWVGLWVKIPLARFPAAQPVMEGGVVRVFGQRYVIPQASQQRHIVLAVNVGGAIVPTFLSLYLLTQALAPLRVIVATAAVTLLTYRVARPVAVWGLLCLCYCRRSARPWQPSSWCRSSFLGRVCGRDHGHAYRWRPAACAQGDQVRRTSGLDWWCWHVRWGVSHGDYCGPAGLRRLRPLDFSRCRRHPQAPPSWPWGLGFHTRQACTS